MHGAGYVHEYYYEMTDAMYLTYSTIACMYVWYMSQSAKAEGAGRIPTGWWFWLKTWKQVGCVTRGWSNSNRLAVWQEAGRIPTGWLFDKRLVILAENRLAVWQKAGQIPTGGTSARITSLVCQTANLSQNHLHRHSNRLAVWFSLAPPFQQVGCLIFTGAMLMATIKNIRLAVWFPLCWLPDRTTVWSPPSATSRILFVPLVSFMNSCKCNDWKMQQD